MGENANPRAIKGSHSSTRCISTLCICHALWMATFLVWLDYTKFLLHQSKFHFSVSSPHQSSLICPKSIWICCSTSAISSLQSRLVPPAIRTLVKSDPVIRMTSHYPLISLSAFSTFPYIKDSNSSFRSFRSIYTRPVSIQWNS
jgi:hypothetical protein